MPKRVNTIPVVDFQGGLNLNANALQLAENESSQLLNVDLDPMGGFRRRGAIEEVYKFSAEISRLFCVAGATDTTWLLAPSGNTFRYSSNGSTWNQFTLNTSGTFYDVAAFPHHVSGLNFGYIQKGSLPTEKWTIGSPTVHPNLGTAFEEDFEVLTGGNFVKGQILCQHKEFMFTACTNTAAGFFANRVHFSHPGNAEAWRSKDWFDVGDAEPITALVSYKDSLLIFKQDSVWILRGYDFDSFVLTNVSNNAGAVNANCVAASPDGVYFYSWPYGVYYFDDNGLHYKSSKLQAYLMDNQLAPRTGKESLIWMGHRLYFSNADRTGVDLLWDGIGPTFTFVLDPLLPNDSWTVYSFPTVATSGPYFGGTTGLKCGVAFSSSVTVASDVLGYAILEEEGTRLVRFVRNGSQDVGDKITVASVLTSKPINAYYMTGWQDLDNTAVVKSWGRPVIVMGNLQDASLHFDIYKDYDSVNSQRNFGLVSDVSSLTTLSWGTIGAVGVWAGEHPVTHVVYAGAKWSVPVGANLGIRKGGRIGRATAVAMKVKCTEQLKSWSVDSIVWKYIPKRVRS